MKKAALRGLAIACGLAVLHFCNAPHLPICAFRALTGHRCPLCGMTHALFALAKGHWREALHWHPLSPLALALLVGTVWDSPRMVRFWMPSLILFALYGVWRMAFG